MTGVVLDTNVLVSANVTDRGLEAMVVSLAFSRQVRYYVSGPTSSFLRLTPNASCPRFTR